MSESLSTDPTPAAAPEPKPKKSKIPTFADLADLYAKRLAITSAFPMDRDAMKDMDALILACVLKMDLPKPTPERWKSEPVMAAIELEASKRNPEAARLLTYPTVKVKLYQRSAGENQLPNQEVVYQGVRISFPRDNKRYECPDAIDELFTQGDIA